MFRFLRSIAPIAVLTTLGALFLASGAGAAVAPPEVVGNTVTVSGDAAPDTITLAAVGGFVTVNGTATTLPADGNGEIVVNAGGGNDTVDATALGTSYKLLTINGGEGEDLLTGGAGVDVLNGDAGEDRLVGFKGADEVSGGDGNDVMVWNNGDGTDRNDGGAGVDEVEVNGSPTAGDEFEAGGIAAEPGFVLFQRINFGKFAIELRAERLTVNGLGGDDHFSPSTEAPGLAGLTSLTLNGGSGNDRLQGGDGNDRIVGGTGEDSLGGSAGDDTIVWNNGDGSDPHNEGGPGFDTVVVNGAENGGDKFTLTPGPTGATFQRTNLVPFTLEIKSDTEALAVNGAGGDDTFTAAQQPAGLLVTADGGPGADQLTGSNEADSFVGGSGNDTLTGGRGSDLLDGGEGEDRLFARDGAGDLVRGGAGADSAQTDQVTVDAVDGVESLDAVPAPEPGSRPGGNPTATLPTVGRIAVTRSHGALVAHAPVSCPAAEAGGCRTGLTLETAKAVRLGRVRAVLVLGSSSVDLAAGQSRTVSVRLNRAAVGLAVHGRLPARVRVSSSDAAGDSVSGSLTVGLRIPRH